jgi:hypothetical protein
MHSWVSFGTLTSTDRSEVPVRSSPLLHFSGLVRTLLLVAVLAAGCNGDKQTASTAAAPQLTTTAPTGGPELTPGQKATFVGALLPAAGKESSFGLKGNDRLKLVSQGRASTRARRTSTRSRE